MEILYPISRPQHFGIYLLLWNWEYCIIRSNNFTSIFFICYVRILYTKPPQILQLSCLSCHQCSQKLSWNWNSRRIRMWVTVQFLSIIVQASTSCRVYGTSTCKEVLLYRIQYKKKEKMWHVKCLGQIDMVLKTFAIICQRVTSSQGPALCPPERYSIIHTKKELNPTQCTALVLPNSRSTLYEGLTWSTSSTTSWTVGTLIRGQLGVQYPHLRPLSDACFSIAVCDVCNWFSWPLFLLSFWILQEETIN